MYIIAMFPSLIPIHSNISYWFEFSIYNHVTQERRPHEYNQTSPIVLTLPYWIVQHLYNICIGIYNKDIPETRNCSSSGTLQTIKGVGVSGA